MLTHLIRLSRRSAYAVSLAMGMAFALGTLTAAPAAANPNKTYEGRKLSVAETMSIVYDAGFRDERTLLTVTSIAIAESSLYTRLRHWHPEHGYRPAGSVLGVQGPSWVWSSAGTQAHADRGLFQIHSYYWPQYTDAMTDDPAQAARLVHAISKGGTDFTPWHAYTSGDAQRSWDAAYNGWPALRPLVRAFLSERSSTAPGAAPVAAPPARPEPGTRHTFSGGDTLYRLAGRYYGNPDLWPRIASANSIADPENVWRGSVIVIP